MRELFVGAGRASKQGASMTLHTLNTSICSMQYCEHTSLITFFWPPHGYAHTVAAHAPPCARAVGSGAACGIGAGTETYRPWG